jgi:hypothetical protein
MVVKNGEKRKVAPSVDRHFAHLAPVARSVGSDEARPINSRNPRNDPIGRFLGVFVPRGAIESRWRRCPVEAIISAC